MGTDSFSFYQIIGAYKVISKIMKNIVLNKYNQVKSGQIWLNYDFIKLSQARLGYSEIIFYYDIRSAAYDSDGYNGVF